MQTKKSFYDPVKTGNANVLAAVTVRRVIPVCLVYAIVQSMTFMVDAILAGRMLGQDAAAAVGLGLPIIGLMLSVTSLTMHGGFLKMLASLGKSDMDGYNRIYSITMVFTILIDLVFVAICLFGTDAVVGIAGGAKAAPQVAEMARLYVRSACLMILFFAVGSIFQIVSATFGYQTERMASSLINVVVNIAVSVFAIGLLPAEMKIAGLGIGSAAGALVQMIVAFIFVKVRKLRVKFRFFALNKKNVVDALDCLRKGLPSSIDNVLDSASSTVVNRIILSVFVVEGTGVLAVFTILKTVFNLVRAIGRGSFYASEPLMGILHGSRDNQGICKTFKTAMGWGLVYTTVFAVLTILLRQPVLSFFKMAGSPDANTGLILLALGGIVVVFPFMLNAAYESTEHLLLSLVVAVIPDSILFPLLIPVLAKFMGVTGLWVAMAFAFIPFFIVFYLIFAIINKKLIVPLERLLALPNYENRDTALDISIPLESVQVSFVSEKLQSFFLEKKTSPRLAFITALCMEEIAADYLEYRRRSNRQSQKDFMDIKAFRDPEKIEIILRNYDKPYNPLLIEKDDSGEPDVSKIGILMTQKMASRVLYSYAYHLNVVTIIIPTEAA